MEKGIKLTKVDFIILIVIVLFYGIFSFYHLGSFDNPNSFVTGGTYTFSLTESMNIDKMRYFVGNEMEFIKVSYSVDGKSYTEVKTIKDKYAFSWNDFEIGDKIKNIRLELSSKTTLGEIALYNTKEEIVTLQSDSTKALKMIDERHTVPKQISHLNSTYFDEIYFARTAYEYANGLPAYEWVHPPLGKLLMAIPIKLGKMAPFYYRFMGNVAGILMLPVLYILAKRMFKKTKYALFATLLLCFDGFHYAHTRMATVDSFLVLFILLSFLFMYQYLLSKNKSLKHRCFQLFLSGLFMGLSISVKWTGCFAAMGLAILFFIDFFKRYKKKDDFRNEGKDVIMYCTLFFVIIPIIIFSACYLCFPNMYYFQVRNTRELGFIMKNMFDYHAGLKEPHPFYSAWYTWPLMLKPVWYYVGYYGNLKATISGFGNPIVWWLGLLGMFYMIYKCFRKDKRAFCLLIFYICLLISYFKISRGMYLYHYFPALPFAILGATYLIMDITEKCKKNYFYIGILVFVIYFFIYFFKVISGIWIEPQAFEPLKWFDSWIF